MQTAEGKEEGMSLYRGALASGPRAAPCILVALAFIVSVSHYVCPHVSSYLLCVCVCAFCIDGDGLNCTCSSSQVSVV